MNRLFRNDIFAFDGSDYRLLQTEAQHDVAWILDVRDAHAWPRAVPLSVISALPAKEPGEVQAWRKPSAASERRRDDAWRALSPLLKHGAALFNPQTRYQLVQQYSLEVGASRPSLYKWLRMYWRNGQSQEALLPNLSRCGRKASENDPSFTSGRGAKARHGGETYQLRRADLEHFKELIEERFLKDERAQFQSVYQLLLKQYYTVLDGNGTTMLLGPGARPSLRQFQYFLRKSYAQDYVLRKRKGPKEYQLKHREVVGTITQDCQGVGHWFECDATIADVYLVASDDVQSIIGKPTVYFIVDRFSRLIVGLYVGLENPSWVCAKQALLFISEDKRDLCARYGVAYDPSDWPAHMVFPQSVLADLGEWNSKGGEQLGRNLMTRVAFAPPARADWKPVVESSFKMLRATLQPGTPGFDPPENAKKRQGKHYERDACLNLDEFTKLILEAVIAHNRMPVRAFALDTAALREEFVATPIHIWNRDIAHRSGVLTRYDVEHVRMELLASDQASVTEHGIEFRGCLYTTDAAVARGWFARARQGRFKVTVSYDMRLVDNIYVHALDERQRPFLCQLSPRSAIHRGRSFPEVLAYERLRAKLQPMSEQLRLEAQTTYLLNTSTTLQAAKKRLSAAPKQTRSARRADTKAMRQGELGKERQHTASLQNKVATDASASGDEMKQTRIVELNHVRKAKADAQQQQATTGLRCQAALAANQPFDLSGRARLAREKMKTFKP